MKTCPDPRSDAVGAVLAPMPMGPFPASIVFLAIGGACAIAQTREPIVGAAVTIDGTPWADAEVVLLLPTHTGRPELGVQERLVVRTDASGRFRAEGLAGRTYTVFAHDRDAAGRQRASATTEANTAIAVALAARGKPALPPRVRLSGTAPHTQRGPLYAQWAYPFDALQPVPADGEVVMPPPTSDWPMLRITRTDGVLLLATTFPASNGGAHELAPPSPVLLRALDGPGGKRVADAEVRFVVAGERAIPMGRTDADGYAEIDASVFRHGDAFHDLRLFLQVFAAGRQASLVHEVATGVLDEAGRAALRASGGCQAFATLPSTQPIPGRLLLDADTPAANVPVLVRSRARVSHRRGAHTSADSAWLTTTDAEGRYVVDHHAPGEPLQVVAMLPLEMAARWPQVATTCVPLLALPEPPDVLPRAVDDVVLAAIEPMRLVLREPTGAPALGAAVHADLVATGTTRPVLLADRRGACVLALPKGVTMDLAIASAEGSWLGRLRGGATGDQPLSLWADRTIECRVRDAQGRPHAGTPSLARQLAVVRWQAPEAEARAVERLPGERLAAMVDWLPDRVRRTGDGDWLLTVTDLPMPWLVRADHHGRHATTTFQGGAPVAPLVLQF